MSHQHPHATRREFLRRAGQLSMAGAAAPWALNLAAMAEAAAQSAPDYKALVCVFLYGGNDHGNTLVPYDSISHTSYSNIRGALATPRSALAATEKHPDQKTPQQIARQDAKREIPHSRGQMMDDHAG